MKRDEKVEFVKMMKEEIKKYPTIAIISLTKLPNKALQSVRKNLRDEVKIKVVKKRLLHRILEEIEGNKIKDIIPEQPALVLSNLKPFELFIKINKIKTPVYAKEGDISEEDILLKAGKTDLNAGPVISEFAKVRIPAGVQEGKIAIKKDTLVAKKGDRISKDLASILRKLKIMPISVTVNVVGIYSNGELYPKDVLEFVNEVPSLLVQAKQKALNLSVFISYPTKENISFLLSKAYNQAKSLESYIGGVK
jgi:large subunit ribosomal protein L10